MIRTPLAPRSIFRSERCLSRRCFLHAAAGTLGALGAGLLWPTAARAAGRDPKPIPGGVPNSTGGPFLHHYFPGPADAMATQDGPPGESRANPGSDPSAITDFEGTIGVAHVQGTGTGTDTDTGNSSPLLFDGDLRFMQGVYQSVDGQFREARFVFI
jgi:hypothetical protein